MGFYRKKLVIIDAFQMTKKCRWDNSEWPNWLNQAWQREPGEGAVWIDPDDPEREKLVCGTLGGVYRIDFDDWIIQGIKGELYPVKPNVFAETYDPVAADESESDDN